MLTMCKYSLYESKSTLDLHDDADQDSKETCTSKLQTWHRKGTGVNFPDLTISITVLLNKSIIVRPLALFLFLAIQFPRGLWHWHV